MSATTGFKEISLHYYVWTVVYESECILNSKTKGKVSPCQRLWQYIMPCGACIAHVLVTGAQVYVPMLKAYVRLAELKQGSGITQSFRAYALQT